MEAQHFDFHAVFMHCVSEIDPCTGVSCGHGTCTAFGRTSHGCDCDPGYAGDHCETSNYIDEHILLRMFSSQPSFAMSDRRLHLLS